MSNRVRSARNLLGSVTVLAAMLAIPNVACAEFHVLRRATLGGEGGWDYVTVDESGHRLYIARSSHVMVVDADSLRVIGDLPNTPGVHGVALVPPMGTASPATADTSVTMFDLAHCGLRHTRRHAARCVVYDPASGECSRSTAVATMPPRRSQHRRRGPASRSMADKLRRATAGRMYVNLEDSSQVVVVDTRSLKVVGRWSLAPGESPTGLALDTAHGRLFSGCGNQKLVVSDVKSGKVITTLPIGDRVDGVAFDPALGLVFSSNGEGTLTVVRQESPGTFTVVGNVPTAVGARTLALDPHTHRIYLVTAQFGTAPAPTTEQPHPRPPLVPGSFEVLVVGEK
jgi:hypothetical protein